MFKKDKKDQTKKPKDSLKKNTKAQVIVKTKFNHNSAKKLNIKDLLYKGTPKEEVPK